MILKADAISHRFSPRGPGVLRGVSAEFRAGEVTAIVGPNGSGKTTLLRLLMGLERPTSGAATLDGADTAGLSAGDRAARMAYMPQHDAVAFDFTAEQVVGFGLFRAGRDGAVVHECLERVGLGDRGGSAVRTLSAGQRQRVSLARVLAQLSRATEGSGVLLADEPIAALDPAHARTAMGLLRREASRGRAVVVVLHELHAVLRAADRVLVMDAGGTVAGWGPPGEVLTPQRLAGVYGVEFDPVLDEGGRLRALLPPLDAASG